MELVRKTLPWDNLGTTVDELTAEDAITQAGLDYTVYQRRLLTEDHVFVPGYTATVRSDTGGILGITSDRYKIIQNNEAFAFADTLVNGHGLTYVNAGALHGGKQVWVTCKLPQQKILDDDLDMYLVLFNSHDGKGSIHICLTPIRVACANMQNLALKNSIAQFSIYHSNLAADRLAEANQTLRNYMQYVNELNVIAGNLVATKLSDSDAYRIFDSVYPHNNLGPAKERNLLELREAVVKAAYEDDLNNYKGTAWGFLQGAIDVAQHRLPKRISNTFKERQFITMVNGQTVIDDYISVLRRL